MLFDIGDTASASWTNVIIAVPVSLALGLLIAWVYKRVAPSASYSVSILHSIVYLAMIVSLIMIVVANEIARAFTLVGALAVIRFRTPVKDARDTAFIFLGLAAGMGAGVGLYLVAILGISLIGVAALLMHASRFGIQGTRETLLKFNVPLNGQDPVGYYRGALEKHLQSHRLVNVRSLTEAARLELTFLIQPSSEGSLVSLSRELSSNPNVRSVSIMSFTADEMSSNVY